MTDPQHDPEVERLACVVSAAEWGTSVEWAPRPVNDDRRIAAAVLTPLGPDDPGVRITVHRITDTH